MYMLYLRCMTARVCVGVSVCVCMSVYVIDIYLKGFEFILTYITCIFGYIAVLSMHVFSRVLASCKNMYNLLIKEEVLFRFVESVHAVRVPCTVQVIVFRLLFYSR